MSFSDHYYWGPLVNPDKSPTPLLEQLCLGIAQLMVTFHECGTSDLTPERLAAFYHKVGGNYDTLFLETKSPALSFIYQSLGCFHSLQASANAFEPPSLPALLPSGFVRWQTIQILLDPDEHAEYMQAAVRLWDIRNPCGGFFPKSIPRDAFPSEPDPEMVQWHEQVSRRLEYDYLKRKKPRASPPNFGPYQYHYLPKYSPSTEENAVSRRRRPGPPFRYVEPHDTPPHVQQRGGSSAGQPQFSSHKGSRPDGMKPRPPSPSVRPDRSAKSRRGRAASIAHPSGPETMPGYYPSDASEDSQSPDPEPSPPSRRYRRRKLSPPRTSRSRPHSHEAYARKPPREISPDYYKRYSHHDEHGSSAKGWYDSQGPPRARSWVYKDDLPHPKESGVNFREYTFDDPAAAHSRSESPASFHGHPAYMGGANPGYMAPPRASNDEHARRRSYNGGIPERPRPSAAPAVSSWSPRWGAPVQSSAKKYPMAMPDMEYASSGRRPVYDR